jgi:hypothetical protein
MSTDLAAVNPSTGEVLEHLDQQPPAALAEALAAVHQHQAELKQWNDALERELRARLKDRQTRLAVFGDWEIQLTVNRARDWDPDELEHAMKMLAADGVVPAGDMADIIVREPKVAGQQALNLLNRLDGQARELVEHCFTWRETRASITVKPSVQLPAVADAAPPAFLGPVPAGPQPTETLDDLFAA